MRAVLTGAPIVGASSVERDTQLNTITKSLEYRVLRRRLINAVSELISQKCTLGSKSATAIPCQAGSRWAGAVTLEAEAEDDLEERFKESGRCVLASCSIRNSLGAALRRAIAALNRGSWLARRNEVTPVKPLLALGQRLSGDSVRKWPQSIF